jgi:predicted Rossmann fold nucleotide-binding protein DprA/Smf involved in DNA uptake
MNYAIIGSTNYKRLDLVRAFIQRHLPADARVVSGGATGVDSEAEREARALGHEVYVIRAQWIQNGRYIKSAGKQRNPLIIAEADRVVAFWNGEDGGTRQGIELARKQYKPLLIVYEDGTMRREEPESAPTQAELWQ